MTEHTTEIPNKDLLKGTIKYYSADKNFGSIYGDDQLEYHLSDRDLKGVWFPKKGDSVTFEASKTGKGKLKAISVLITQAAPTSSRFGYEDNRVICPSCNRHMTPQTEKHYGSLLYTYCPACTAVYKDFRKEGCFIATAIYGSYQAPEVIALRHFRDDFLNTTWFGRKTIELYYFASPPIANYIATRPFLKNLIRPALTAFSKRFSG